MSFVPLVDIKLIYLSYRIKYSQLIYELLVDDRTPYIYDFHIGNIGLANVNLPSKQQTRKLKET